MTIFQDEMDFDGLREAQGLRRAQAYISTSKRHGPQCDKARRKIRSALISPRGARGPSRDLGRFS
jgi:hypothetical protein